MTPRLRPGAELDVRLVAELPDAPEAAALAAAAPRRRRVHLECDEGHRAAPGEHRCAACGSHRFVLVDDDQEGDERC